MHMRVGADAPVEEDQERHRQQQHVHRHERESRQRVARGAEFPFDLRPFEPRAQQRRDGGQARHQRDPARHNSQQKCFLPQFMPQQGAERLAICAGAADHRQKQEQHQARHTQGPPSAE